jgi:hypothetical protein
VTVAGFVLHHSHAPGECGVAYAAFKGHASPLRHRRTVASCLSGGHEVWWFVEAASVDAALALLPHYVAQRSTAIRVREVPIP